MTPIERAQQALKEMREQAEKFRLPEKPKPQPISGGRTTVAGHAGFAQ